MLYNKCCKQYFAFIFFIIALPITSEGYWGWGISFGYWKADVKDLKTSLDSNMRYQLLAPVKGSVEGRNFNWNFEVFYEYPFTTQWSLGVLSGIGEIFVVKESEMYYTAVEGYDYSGFMADDIRAVTIPITFYVKWKKGGNSTGLFLGGGTDYLSATTTHNDRGGICPFNFPVVGKFRNKKLASHIIVGIEHRCTENFILGLSVKYLFSAIIENFRGRFGGSKAAEYYFPGEWYLTMESYSFGERLGMRQISVPLDSSARLFKVDFSGPYINLVLRCYFGGRTNSQRK